MENVFEYYDSVREQEVEWLWYPYIPYGKLTLLEGDPGEGKSTLMIQIASLLTNEKKMPDGYPVRTAETVIYQCNEDDVADTVKPRLKAAGADCSKIAYIIDRNSSLTLNDERIINALKQTKARLLVLDPFQSFLLQNGDLHSIGRIRTVLGNLALIAAEYRCAVVFIGHMNKSIGGKSLYLGLGSIDITAIARSVSMVTRDEDDTEVRYMLPIKSSLAPEGREVAFKLSKKHGFQWIKGERKNAVKHIGKDAAAEILAEYLLQGEAASTDVFQKMQEIGISERTLYTIKKQLGIKSHRKNDIWYWKLPDSSEVTEDGV